MNKKTIMIDMDEVIVVGRFCVDVIKQLNQENEVYIVSSYIWKEDAINAATNLKNKYDYLHYWFPFIDSNNFIFMTDKTKIEYDIGNLSSSSDVI